MQGLELTVLLADHAAQVHQTAFAAHEMLQDAAHRPGQLLERLADLRIHRQSELDALLLRRMRQPRGSLALAISHFERKPNIEIYLEKNGMI